jgi:hypothetical protein
MERSLFALLVNGTCFISIGRLDKVTLNTLPPVELSQSKFQEFLEFCSSGG